MNSKKHRLLLLALVVAILVGASLLGASWNAARSNAAKAQSRRVLFYQDSMHPWIKSESPGKCTLCNMDLTAIYEGQGTGESSEECVSLSSNAVTVLNVQTEAVQRQPLVRTLRVAGTLEANEAKRTIISAPAPGRIEDLAIEYAGVEVHEGQRLLTFFSPELTQERRRYVVRARLSDQRDPTGGLAKPKSDADPYYSDLVAPHAGTVIERKVTRGQYVSEGERLFTIADSSVLWYRFDIYEQQLPWVRAGQQIQVRVPAVPGKVFRAVISFVDPMLNEATRTVKVRADIPNPAVETAGKMERSLRFGMYAEGIVLADTLKVLTVPRAAILYPGHSAYAYVDNGHGTYERRHVKLGREGNGTWEILGGLSEGERVVSSGAVLLDAQAQFNQGSADRMADGAIDTVPEAASADMTPPPVPAKIEMGHSLDAHAASEAEPMSRVPDTSVVTQARTADPMAPALEREASAPRVSKRGDGPHGGRVGGRLMMEDLTFQRLREVRSAEMRENAPSTNKAPPSLSEGQRRSMQVFLTNADQIAQALAADDLERFNQQTLSLSNNVAGLQKEFVLGDRWKGMVHHFLGALNWRPAANLVAARAQFQPFTINVVALAKELKKQEQGFDGLKIYHCPMAPEPGLWMQTQGPLANPFFGAKMLRCGEEVKVEGQLALRQDATSHDKQ